MMINEGLPNDGQAFFLVWEVILAVDSWTWEAITRISVRSL